MSLPRKHRRSITLDARVYHYLVRPSREGRSTLTVALAEHQSQPIRTCFRPHTAVTPKLVRQFIEDAVARGWHHGRTPDMAGYDEQKAPAWIPRRPGEGGISAWPVAAVYPLEQNYPWPHACGGAVCFELTDDTSSAAIGALMATWCAEAEVEPTMIGDVLTSLCRQETRIDGGLQWRSDGVVEVEPGCCAALGGWREWRSFLEDGKFWGGHDPWVSLAADDDGIQIHPGTPKALAVRLSREAYIASLQEVEDHLLAFTKRLRDWVAVLDPTVSDAVAKWFRRVAAL